MHVVHALFGMHHHMFLGRGLYDVNVRVQPLYIEYGAALQVTVVPYIILRTFTLSMWGSFRLAPIIYMYVYVYKIIIMKCATVFGSD